MVWPMIRHVVAALSFPVANITLGNTNIDLFGFSVNVTIDGHYNSKSGHAESYSTSGSFSPKYWTASYLALLGGSPSTFLPQPIGAINLMYLAMYNKVG